MLSESKDAGTPLYEYPDVNTQEWEEYVKKQTARSGGPAGVVVGGATSAWDTIKNVFLGKKGEPPLDYGENYGPEMQIRKRNYFRIRKSYTF